ncbi:MAG: cyclase family protein [Proteocatella sp.]
MKLFDMTHLIKEDMPVFPGTEKPILKTANTIEKDGFKETLMSMFSHTGTHMDAPSHIFKDRKNLDEFEVSYFSGNAFVMDFSKKREGENIDIDELLKYEEKIKLADYVIIRTGWDRYWGMDEYYQEFPVLTKEATEYLVQKNIRGIGLDTISLDSMKDISLPNHRIVLSNDMVIIENLTGLEVFGEEIFMVYFMPLKYKAADGAPIRAFGSIN